MKYSRRNRLLRAVTFFLAATLAACGQGPESGDQGLAYSAEGFEELSPEITKLFAEEKALRNNPDCALAPERYLSSITDVIERFNDGVVSWRNAPYLAYHPGGAEGIAVLLCNDNRVAAYAYTKTVAAHSGLLAALEERVARVAPQDSTEKREELFRSALAFVLYHELAHAEMGHAFRIAHEKPSGSFSASLLELQADAYAAAALHAAGFSMEGAEIVFDLLEETNPSGAISHPTSNERAVYLGRYGG